MEIGVDALRQRPGDASAAVFPPSSGPTASLVEIRGGLDSGPLVVSPMSATSRTSRSVASFWRGGYIEEPEMRREFLEEVRSRNPWS
jgi:hypothetical protein